MSEKLDAIEPAHALLDQFAESLAQVLESMAEQRPEATWQPASGTVADVVVTSRSMTDDDGRVIGFVGTIQDITERKIAEEKLEKLAYFDPLTGLANYRHLVETVNSEIKRSERTGREFALLFLDLDGLKRINDSFGHLVGSQALCRLADVLCICSRDIDTSARFGGDEFALVLPETGRSPASLVAGRVRDRLANDGKEPKLSVSIGVSIYPHDGQTIDALLSAADAALYSIKTASRPPAAKKAKQVPQHHTDEAADYTTGALNR